MDFFEIPAYAEGETANTASGTTQDAAGTGTTTQKQPGTLASMLSMLLPIVLIIVLFYFMMIKPQRKKEKETKAMIDAMKVGDKVVTIGGICGKVVKIKDQFVFIESGNIGTENERSVIKMERDAVKTVEQKIKN